MSLRADDRLQHVQITVASVVILSYGVRRTRRLSRGDRRAEPPAYLVKPISATELVARVLAALRRQEGPEPFVLGGLATDYERYRVTVGRTAVELAATEYEFLRVLSLIAGRVVTVTALEFRVWTARARGGRSGSRRHLPGASPRTGSRSRRRRTSRSIGDRSSGRPRYRADSRSGSGAVDFMPRPSQGSSPGSRPALVICEDRREDCGLDRDWNDRHS